MKNLKEDIIESNENTTLIQDNSSNIDDKNLNVEHLEVLDVSDSLKDTNDYVENLKINPIIDEDELDDFNSSKKKDNKRKKSYKTKEIKKLSNDNDKTIIIENSEENSEITKENKVKNKKEKVKKEKVKKEKIKSSIPRIIIATFIVLVILIGLAGAYIGLDIAKQIVATSPTLNVNDFDSKESSKIFDKDGNLVVELGVFLRENITYEEMPSSLIDAFVSIEDSRFFDHDGFDIPRFMKALLENIKSKSFAQGGSTFTMQLVKNTYFTMDETVNIVMAEKSIDRKVQEIFLATELEKIISKEKVFELYLNKLNFGQNIRGVQKAANYYFNKNASELVLSESALLAGIINLPNAYNPYNNLADATTRRNTVLDMMLYHGYISEMECTLAKAINIEDQLKNGSSKTYLEDYKYQGYIDEVINEAIDITGSDPAMVSMDIYTNLDTKVQEVVEQIQNQELVDYKHDLLQSAIVVMDNTNGKIVALGGGRDYQGSRLLNRATDMYQQPGSTIKPVLSYALAFEHLGYATSHIVCDRPIRYAGTDIVIKNFDGKYRGDLTLSDAVEISMNTPAINTLLDVVKEIGNKGVVDYLNSVGYEVDLDQFNSSYAIGGSSFMITPVQMAASHATMINYGVYNTPHTINKIVMNDKETIVNGNPEQVLSEGSAYMTSLLMENAVTGKYYNYMEPLVSPYEVYAKTGTTDWSDDGLIYGIPRGAAKEKWIAASTTQYTTAVWLGFDEAVKGENTYYTSRLSKLNLPGNIANIILDTLHDDPDNYPKSLVKPDSVESITHVMGTFPYASANGIGYETTGLINEKFNTLVNFYDHVPNQLNGISIVTDEFGVANVYFSALGFESTNELLQKDISLNFNNTHVDAWGAQLFSYSWILGSPTFVGKVYFDNVFQYDITSNANSYQIYDGVGKVKVCGYMQFPNGTTSNSLCSN